MSLSFFERTHDVITKIGYFVGVVALLFILLALCGEIISRYFFLKPTRWVNDFSGYALLFSTCLVIPKVTSEKGNIAVTYLQDTLGNNPKKLLGLLIGVISILACFWAGIYAVQEAIRQYERGISTIAVTPVPRWWMSAAIAYSLISSGLYFCRIAIKEIKEKQIST